MDKKIFFFCCLSFLTLQSGILLGLENLNLLRYFEQNLHEEFLSSRKEMIDDLIEAVNSEISYYGALSETADWRHQLACLQKSSPEKSFGKMRTEEAFSNLTNAGGKDHIEKVDLILKKSKRQTNHPFFKDVDFYEYQMYGVINNEKIPITKVIYLDHDSPKKDPDNHSKENNWYTFKRYTYAPKTTPYYYYVAHTEPAYLQQIDDHLSAIWEKVLYEKNQEGKLQLIAEFHWWFANAMPFERGSAAIGEVLTETLLKCSGYQWEKKKHLLIDIEALLEPCMEEFIRKYPTYYDKVL